MNYKVCILAAGKGSRMGNLTNNLNKALLPINFKAAISYVIEKHPISIEIIVAVNYKSEEIKEYLDCAYPSRKIKYVYVDEIGKQGSGPGYSLLCCKKYLQTPFIISTVDTLVKEDCPLPKNNWMGIDNVQDTQSYCSVLINANTGLIKEIKDKQICWISWG